MNRYNLPDKTIFPLATEDLDILMSMQYLIYPEPFVETREYMDNLLKSDGLNIGIIIDKKLVGFLLTILDSEHEIFLYDIGILPEYQRRGLGKILVRKFLTDACQKKLNITLSCRNTSVGLFSDPEVIGQLGYKIVKCEFEADGYFECTGIHEDSYNIRLELLR